MPCSLRISKNCRCLDEGKDLTPIQSSYFWRDIHGGEIICFVKPLDLLKYKCTCIIWKLETKKPKIRIKSFKKQGIVVDHLSTRTLHNETAVHHPQQDQKTHCFSAKCRGIGTKQNKVQITSYSWNVQPFPPSAKTVFNVTCFTGFWMKGK